MQQIRYSSPGSEFYDAFRSTRAAKNIFWIILGLCILFQLAAFVAVHVVGVVDPIYAAAPDEAPVFVDANAPDDALEPNAPVDANAPLDANAPARPGAPARRAPRGENGNLMLAQTVDQILYWAMPATRFFAFVSAALLWLALLLAVKISLIDRLGGAGYFTSANFWSLVLLGLVVPWQQVLGGFAMGALYNYQELLRGTAAIEADWSGASPNTQELVLYYARFAGYPVLALLLWIVVQAKWRGGYRRVEDATSGSGPVRPEPRVDRPGAARPAQGPSKSGSDRLDNAISG